MYFSLLLLMIARRSFLFSVVRWMNSSSASSILFSMIDEILLNPIKLLVFGMCCTVICLAIPSTFCAGKSNCLVASSFVCDFFSSSSYFFLEMNSSILPYAHWWNSLDLVQTSPFKVLNSSTDFWTSSLRDVVSSFSFPSHSLIYLLMPLVSVTFLSFIF